jgi:hypothetical protein
MSDLMMFTKSLDDFAKDANAMAVGAVRFFAKDIYDSVIQDAERSTDGLGSPVLKGDFYNNHRIALNSPDLSVDIPARAEKFIRGVDTPRPPLSASTAMPVLSAVKLGDSVFITNSVPYADILEREGWSKKTPNGIYDVAVVASLAKFNSVSKQELVQLGGR